jgi:hypothetical protein
LAAVFPPCFLSSRRLRLLRVSFHSLQACAPSLSRHDTAMANFLVLIITAIAWMAIFGNPPIVTRESLGNSQITIIGISGYIHFDGADRLERVLDICLGGSDMHRGWRGMCTRESIKMLVCMILCCTAFGFPKFSMGLLRLAASHFCR